ncbi:MAG: hypothetical protein KBS86_01580 [Proteobacteria bacterium]|nr:hypothetical protein [Candidatus Enterousia scatequi]
MQLKYITCSDPREFNDINDIIKLGQISPLVEIAIQSHPSKMSPGMPRFQWFEELVLRVASDKSSKINLAMHINREYCDSICRFGKIPTEIKQFFDFTYENGSPIIQRIQLNMPADTAKKVNIRKLSELIAADSKREFIFQYNDETKTAVQNMYKMGTCFSVLYDASGGRGMSPAAWQKPVFANRFQGYSGGISPANVIKNLDDINSVVWAKKRPIWIDAEGRLKQYDMFNIDLARTYINNALAWQKIR